MGKKVKAAFDRGSSLFLCHAVVGRLRFLSPIAATVHKRVLRKGYAVRRRVCTENLIHIHLD